MSAGERARAARPAAGRDVRGPRIEVSPDVGGERAGRRIAARRLPLQGGEHDVVERSGEPLAQAARGRIPLGGPPAAFFDSTVQVAHHRLGWRRWRRFDAPSLGDAP
jgi:hypothetical protein